MAYKAIDAQVKVDAVKQYWASGNISQISKKTGSSRAAIYSWIALAENALLEAFTQTHPGPRSKSLQEENEVLKTQLKQLYDKYHKESRPRPVIAPEDAPPQLCTDCGSAQIRKNGTVPFKHRGTCQRYTCRQCSLSIYIVLKKNDVTTELHLCLTEINATLTAPMPAVGAINSSLFAAEGVEVQSRVHYVTTEASQWAPSGFLCLLADFAETIGFFDIIQDVIRLPSKEVHYTHLEKIKTLIAMIALGCQHIKDINHRLRPYPALAHSFGMEQFPEQSQINRLLHSFSGHLGQLDQLFETLLKTSGLCQKQEKVHFDFDCTGLVVYGNTFELCRKGYFSRRRGSQGYQLSLGYTFGYSHSEIVSLHLDPGNAYPSARFWDAIYQVAELLGSLDRLGIIRADGAQGSGPNLEGLIETDLEFVIKGYAPQTARIFARDIRFEQWEPIDLFTRVADLGLCKITHCRPRVNVIVVETLNARRQKMDYFNLFTHLKSPMSAPEVFAFYNARQNIEALIKGEKYGLNITPMKTRNFAGNYAFLYFAAITFNLLSWFKHQVLKGTELEHLGLCDLTSKLMQIPAQYQVNNNQLELAFPNQHPMIKQLSQPAAH